MVAKEAWRQEDFSEEHQGDEASQFVGRIEAAVRLVRDWPYPTNSGSIIRFHRVLDLYTDELLSAHNFIAARSVINCITRPYNNGGNQHFLEGPDALRAYLAVCWSYKKMPANSHVNPEERVAWVKLAFSSYPFVELINNLVKKEPVANSRRHYAKHTKHRKAKPPEQIDLIIRPESKAPNLNTLEVAEAMQWDLTRIAECQSFTKMHVGTMNLRTDSSALSLAAGRAIMFVWAVALRDQCPEIYSRYDPGIVDVRASELKKALVFCHNCLVGAEERGLNITNLWDIYQKARANEVSV